MLEKTDFTKEEWPRYTIKNCCINRHVALFLVQTKQKGKGIRLQPLEPIRVSLWNDLWNHDLPIQPSFLYLEIMRVHFNVAQEKGLSVFFYYLSFFFGSQEKIFSKTPKSFCVLSTQIPNPKPFHYFKKTCLSLISLKNLNNHFDSDSF